MCCGRSVVLGLRNGARSSLGEHRLAQRQEFPALLWCECWHCSVPQHWCNLCSQSASEIELHSCSWSCAVGRKKWSLEIPFWLQKYLLKALLWYNIKLFTSLKFLLRKNGLTHSGTSNLKHLVPGQDFIERPLVITLHARFWNRVVWFCKKWPRLPTWPIFILIFPFENS